MERTRSLTRSLKRILERKAITVRFDEDTKFFKKGRGKGYLKGTAPATAADLNDNVKVHVRGTITPERTFLATVVTVEPKPVK